MFKSNQNAVQFDRLSSVAPGFRCSDPVWKREMARWVGVVVDKVRPQLATVGVRPLLSHPNFTISRH